MAPNHFRNMPTSKKPPVILAQQQPASIAPATVTTTALPKMPAAKPKQAAPVVVVATPEPAPARQETHAEFLDRTLKENLAASAAANEAARKTQQERDFGSGPAVNAEPSTPPTDDERAAVDEESATAEEVFEVDAQENEEEEDESVVVEAHDPEPVAAAPKRQTFLVELEPLPLPTKSSADNIPRVAFPPRPVVLELFYNDEGLLRLASDGRLLTSEEVARLPEAYRPYAVSEVSSVETDDDDVIDWGEPVPDDFLARPTEKYRTFTVHLTSGVWFEAFYDEDRRMRVVEANGGALSADEARLLPYSTAAEREVRYRQCMLLGIRDEHRYDGDEKDWGESVLGDLPLRLPSAVREIDTSRLPTPAIKTPAPARPKIGPPPPRRPQPPSATAPSSGLMSSRVGVLPAAEGRPPMPPIRPRSPPATGRDT
jgi:hypothetical protein